MRFHKQTTCKFWKKIRSFSIFAITILPNPLCIKGPSTYIEESRGIKVGKNYKILYLNLFDFNMK
jgi:hypothetical protein